MVRGTGLQDLLREALTECQRLREENARLRELLSRSMEVMDRPAEPPAIARVFAPAAAPVSAPVIAPVPAAVTARSPVPAKIALFRGLFQARDDVYAVRWERQDGRSGYAPACRNEWERGLCAKPRVKCSECPNRSFLPLTDQVLCDHLAGSHTVGIYPLLADESCWFLAVDFDKAAWLEDAAAFLDACGEMGVPAALERSRSGGGGHVWIFFDRAIPAIQARRLGSAILTLAMERRHQIGLDSYDRFFPNQDTLSKGGFGNLIALPLQRGPRRTGNSLFIDRDLQPYPDQGAFLAGLRRVPAEEVETIVREASRTQTVLGVRASLAEDDDSPDPWLLPPSRGIPAGPVTMLNRLLRLAAFQNPEFHKAQAARLPIFGKPRVIGCGEDLPGHIGLPRGCFADALNLLRSLSRLALDRPYVRSSRLPPCHRLTPASSPFERSTANCSRQQGLFDEETGLVYEPAAPRNGLWRSSFSPAG